MPKYHIDDPTSGRTIELEGDTPPTESDIDEAIAAVKPQLVAQPQSAPQGNKYGINDADYQALTQGDVSNETKNKIKGYADRTSNGNLSPVLGSIYSMGDVAGDVGKNIMSGLGRIAGAITPQFVKNGLHDAGQLINKEIVQPFVNAPYTQDNVIPFVQRHPDFTKTISSLGNIVGTATLPLGVGGVEKVLSSDIPKTIGSALGDIGKKTANATGENIENFGKKVKGAELKIPNSVAKKSYGASIADKQQNIIGDLADYGMTDGNYAKASDKTAEAVQARFDKADELGKKVSADPQTPKLTPTDVALNGLIDADGKIIAGDKLNLSDFVDADQEESAQRVIDNITNNWKKKGFDQPTTLDQLIAAKQSLNKSGNLFKNSVGVSDADNIARTIKKQMYLNITDAIGNISPELQAMNTDAKRLLDVQAALDDAARRTSKNNILKNIPTMMAGGVGAIGAAAHSPETALAGLGAIALDKTLAGGRAGNWLIKGGRYLQGKVPNTIEQTLATAAGKPRLNIGNIATPQTIEANALGDITKAARPIENPDVIPQDYNPETLLSPEEYANRKAMDEAMQAGYKSPTSNAPQMLMDKAKIQLREDLGLPKNRTIAFNELTPEKQKTITGYAEFMNQNPEELTEFEQHLKNSLGDNSGRVSPDDIIQWANEAGNGGAKGKTLDNTKKMLGNERGAVGGNPFRQAQQKTPEFKQWFGDWEKAPEQASKVVDESGKPLVVYHGTRSDFNKFDYKKMNDGTYGAGFYFTEKPNTANIFAGQKQGANIKPTYLDMKRPLDITDEAGDNAEDKLKAMFPKSKNIVEDVIRKGHDGIIIRSKRGDIREAIVYNPNQIKSATGNSGTFSRATNDIRGSGAVQILATGAGLSGAGLTGLGLYQKSKANKQGKK